MNPDLPNVNPWWRHCPPALLRQFARLPPFWRYGRAYARYWRDVDRFEALSTSGRREAILKKFRQLAIHAYESIPFYNEWFNRAGVDPRRIQSIEDIKALPPVRKSDLRAVPLGQRSAKRRRAELQNTGGTSGSPLGFYSDRETIAREYAHMHRIWARLGYRRKDRMLSFRGINLGRLPVAYCPGQNAWAVNTYMGWDETAWALERMLQNDTVHYLHGYPSNLYDFARFASAHAPRLLNALRRDLRGIFLGSEYPAPVWREFIHDIFGVPSISWYGHTEKAVLAAERDTPYVYVPFDSYGLMEVVPAENGRQHLVGTGWDNPSAPFIRYDTEDDIEPLDQEGGWLRAFAIREARSGDYIVGREGQRISLTGLIFGRHHPIFNRARAVQVLQRKAGEATLLVTMEENETEPDWKHEFDASYTGLSWTYCVLNKPIKTMQGKTPLLVPPDRIPAHILNDGCSARDPGGANDITH